MLRTRILPRRRGRDARAKWPLLWAIGGLVSVGAVLVLYRGVRRESAVCQAISEHAAVHPGEPLTVTVFSDFQCAACRRVHEALRPFRDRPGVVIVERQYPLSRACNRRVRRSRRPGVCLQARAATCAGKLGQYGAYSDALFAQGPADREGLEHLAERVGTDMDRFRQCLSSVESERALQADLAQASTFGVQRVPTLVLGTRRHPGVLSATDLGCLTRYVGAFRSVQQSSTP